MNTKKTIVICLDITELPNLDPIRVYIEDYEPGKGRITISCYDMAWVGYWGAMSGRTISKFFVDCDADYLAEKLQCGQYLSRVTTHRLYLLRVVQAVKDALKEGGAA